MTEQSEGNNHTSEINVFPVLHMIFSCWGGGGGGGVKKWISLPCMGQEKALYDPLVGKILSYGRHGKPEIRRNERSGTAWDLVVEKVGGGGLSFENRGSQYVYLADFMITTSNESAALSYSIKRGCFMN